MTSRLPSLLRLRPLSLFGRCPAQFSRTIQIPRSFSRWTAVSAGNGGDEVSRSGRRELLMCRAHVPVMLQQRFKKKKAASNEEEAKESDDEESDEEKDPAIGYETVEVKVASLQADLVARGLFKMTRERAMHLISEGLIRLNDRKTIKNDLVTEFDTLDYIRGRNKENPDLLDIARAQVVYVPDISSTMGRSKIKAHIWRFITIENYKEEPYTGHVQSTQGDEEESNERFK